MNIFVMTKNWCELIAKKLITRALYVYLGIWEFVAQQNRSFCVRRVSVKQGKLKQPFAGNFQPVFEVRRSIDFEIQALPYFKLARNLIAL